MKSFTFTSFSGVFSQTNFSFKKEFGRFSPNSLLALFIFSLMLSSYSVLGQEPIDCPIPITTCETAHTTTINLTEGDTCGNDLQGDIQQNQDDCNGSDGDTNCHQFIFRRQSGSSVGGFITRIGLGAGCNGDMDEGYLTIGDECLDIGATSSQTRAIIKFPDGVNEITLTVCKAASSFISLCGFCTINLDVTCSSNWDCTTNTGTVSVTPPEGAATYSYIWTNSEGNEVGYTQTVSGLPVGDYTVEVIDSEGAVGACTTTIVEETCCLPPVISCPAEATIECGESIDPLDTGNPTATEGCGTVSFTYNDITTPSAVCSNASTITRTWTATDEANNVVTCDQIITVDDTTAPTFDSEPATIADITCDAALPVQEVLTASDTCGNATVEASVDDYTVNVCDGYAITYRWTATDDCGNTAVTTATFNVLPDEIDPTFDSEPATIADITCDAALPVQEVLTASDTCGNATVEASVDDYTVNVCDGYAITYRWTATDDCGNTAVTTATFNVLPDEIDPTFDSEPATIADITCDAALPVQEVLTASDTCGNATVEASVDDYTVNVCDGYAITYRWTATDDCGNTAVTTATFNVLPDEIDPTFDSEPATIADITCDAALPVQEVLTASDTCGNATVEASVDDYTVNVCDGYAITYRWTATDDCGNTAVTTATFNVLPDEIDPTFDSEPATIADITCDAALPVQEVLTASDTCGNATVEASVDDYTVNVCDGYAITYRWTATDDCGNTAVTTATFNVLPDEIDPTFDSEPATIADITCDAALPVQEVLTASDTCGNATVEASVDDYTVNVCDGYAITYRWTATDDCGNTAVTTATFNVLPDEIDPTFDSEPATIADITCDAALPVQEVLTASDTCGNATVEASVDDYTVNVCDGYAITYRWTATDDCGNTAVTTATFNVLPDEIDPTFDSEPATIADITCDAALPVQEVLTASDTCGNATVEASVDDYTVNVCDGYAITYRWTATDDCGNTAVTTATFNVLPDEIDPTFDSEPATIADITCDAALPVQEVLTASDTCGNATVEASVDDYTVNVCDGYAITYRWTATDDCGNTAVTTATFNVLPDEIDPTFDSEPATIADITCDAALPVQEVLTASDTCGNATVEASVDDYTVNVCDGYAITYRWTATDDCGNTAVTTATFNVLPDEIDPTFDSEPATIADITCDAALPVQEVLTASDTCGNATVEASVDDYTVNVCDGYAITYRWTATDDCGNTAVTTATFNVLPDEIDPTFDSEPATIADITCDAALPVQEVLTASDTCGNATVEASVDDYTVNVCDGYAITYRWTATDDCGNTAVTTATFNVLPDEIDPTFDSEPATIADITCDAALPVQEVLTASDTCGNATVEASVDDYTVNVCDGYAITYRWTATDDCGNTAVTTATFNVLPDEIDPTFDSEPATIADITCDAALPVQEVLTASDTCGNATVEASVDDYTVNVCDGYAITYRWTATDDCGNTAVTTATFNVLPDEIDPTFDSEPATIADITCDAALPVQEVLTASDTCGNATVEASVDDYTVNVCDGYAITYRWTATDDCGNTAVTTATFNVLPDEIDPTFDSEPATIADITCDAALPVQEVLTASDTCGNATVEASVDDYTVNVCDGYAITYRWTATDDCGNTAVTTATFNVLPDEIDPTFDSEPATIADITCDAALPVQEVLTASDTCGNATVEASVDDYTVNVCDGYAITYRWTATDDCGNTAVTTATFNVLPDEIDPTFDSEPATIADITCDAALPVQEVLTASDTCGNATVEASVDDYTVNVCDGYAITYRWTATDDCGNTAVTTATFNVLPDTTAPTIFCPADITLECTASTDPSNTGTATASDTCDANPAVTYTDSGTGSCYTGEYVITRTWTAEDDCGNKISCTQLITVAPATVSGHIYADTNGNGQQDVGEPDLEGVDVVITDSQGNTQTVTTDGNGDYTATVPAGDTTANVDETDPDYPAGTTHTEGDDPTTITATFNQNNDIGIDGYFLPGSLNGHLYVDTNGNGQQDAGEPDLANVDVIVTDSEGNDHTVSTDVNGDWIATDLPPGEAIVKVDETDLDYPTGYTQTEGDDPTTVTVVAGVDTNGGTDGYDPAADVSGHLYVDTNGDGDQDAGEPNLAGVDIVITDSSGIPQTVTTDANGDWTAVVLPGSVEVDVDENDPDYPTGYNQTEGDDSTTVTAVANADTDGGIDGYNPEADVSGHIYEDTNGNGTQDAGEPDLANVNVIVTDVSGIPQTVTTDANGNWTAEVLPGDVTADVDDNTLPMGSALAELVQTEGDDPTTVTAIENVDTDAGIDGYNRQADVFIDKTDDGSDAVAGEEYEYTLTVSNAGPWDANDIVVVDTLPEGMSFVSAIGANFTVADQVITSEPFNIIKGGANVVITIKVDVASSVDNGTLINTATANGVETDTNPSNNEDDEPTDVVREADLSITKDDGVTQVTAGDGVTYTYTIEVTNNGPSDADNVTVDDEFPAGFTMGTVTPSQGSCTGADCDLGTIASGDTATITVQYTVPSDTQAGFETNTVTVSSDDPDPNEDNNTDDDKNEVLTSADLSITKDDGVTQVTAGDGVTYTYTIEVTNNGPSDADNVTVDDEFPAGFTMGTVTPSQGSCTGADCDLGTIASGDSATITVQYTVPSDTQAGPQTNTVTVSSDDPDPNEDNNTDDDKNEVLTSADLSITKDDGVPQVTAGDGVTYTYTIEVTNNGPSDADNVTVDDEFPAGFTMGTVTPSQGSCTGADCDLGTIASGDTATITVQYTVPSDTQAGFETNTVTVSSDDPDPNEDNNTDDDKNEVLTSADLSITKDDGVPQVTAGDGVTYTYTIEVTNNGPSDADNVTVEDDFPTGFSIGEVSSSQGACSGFDCNLGTIASGDSATITVKYTVPSATLAGFETNTVSVTSDEPDPNAENNTDSDINEVLTDINLSIVKTFVPEDIEVPQGTFQTFTIEVTNRGPSDAVAVSVTDLVDPILEVVSVSLDTGSSGNCSENPENNVNCTVDIPTGESATVTVKYMTAPFLDEESPYDNPPDDILPGGDDFYFVFVNGSILEGTTRGDGKVYLDGQDITLDVTIVTSLSRNDIIFDPPGDESAFELHLSCSDPFTGGWGQSGGPVEGVDTEWQIAFFTIARFNNNGFIKSCGNVVNDYEVSNMAEASGKDTVGEDTYATDDATVTIGPGITLDRLQTKGKRVTARLTNWTGEDKPISNIEVKWPAKNGNLTKVWLTQDVSTVIWQGNAENPTPEKLILDDGDSGWNGGTLMEHEAILRFDFKNKVANSDYTIRVYFDDGGTWLDISVNGNGNRMANPIVEPTKVETTMSVYPNPVRINFNVKLDGYNDEFAEIVMFDHIGRLILNVKKRILSDKAFTIELPSSIDDGLYYVRLKDDGSMKSIPIIISRMD